ALGHAAHVHPLAGGEDVADGDLAADRRRVAVGETELAQHDEGTRAGFREVTLQRLRETLGPRRTEPELERGVALAVRAPCGDDRARARLDDRDRHERALRRVDLRHAELATDEAADAHCCRLYSTTTPAAKSSLA